MLSLDDLRKYQKYKILSTIRSMSSSLAHFDTIMEKCVSGRGYPRFEEMRTLTDFCDGFMILGSPFTGAKQLQSFLKDLDLNVLLPQP